MLSSKEILDATDISRATLNNYISLGLLSKPVVANPGSAAGGPRQLGFFPDDSIERIRKIQQLKREGYSMAKIAARLGTSSQPDEIEELPTGALSVSPPHAAKFQSTPTNEAGLRVTIEEIAFPAYMVNHSFELVWFNNAARDQVFNGLDKLPPTSEGRNLFRMLAAKGVKPNMTDLLCFHVGLAKGRLSPERFADACQGVSPEAFTWLQDTYAAATAQQPKPVSDSLVSMADGISRAYVSLFREGIFVVLAPEDHEGDAMLEFLARRDEVIRGLLQRRMPVLTDLAVLVADLQGSVRICSELPPDEYFTLINDIWAAMGPIFRKYHGTYGKHVGDGMVYYFFPQPDSNYLFNALACATEIREEIKHLSKRWQLQKNWLNELYLNTGITDGQEWLGTFRSSTSIEFVVLGDTINQAARISDFARFGDIWATKSLIGKLPQESRKNVDYGVRRKTGSGREVFVPTSFATIASLAENPEEVNDKLRDIATVPITEIVDVTKT